MHKQTNKCYKIIAIILCVAMLSATKTFVPITHAWWGVSDVSVDPVNAEINGVNTASDVASLAFDIASAAADELKGPIIVAAKMAAMYAIQKAVALMTGDSGTSGGTVIRDFGTYLFTNAKQKALTQMTSFFTTASNGRISSLNYDGINGKNYDAYLANETKKLISGQTFATSIRDVVADPQSDLFSSGNMRGLMEYMKCANNIACYTMTGVQQYEQNVSQNQTVAQAEQVNGFLPVKDILTGRIKTPAALAQNALLQVDQFGQQMIVNADATTKADLTGSLEQIAAGSVMSIASRAINYGITDKKGDQIASSIKSGTNTFAFSTAYSTLGTSATSTTSEQTYTDAQLLETCSSLNLDVDKTGSGMKINGKQVQCKMK